MKKLVVTCTYQLLLCVAFILGPVNGLRANHAMAVDLTYTCINSNTYELTLWFYFDCGSTVIETPPVNPSIQISSASCGYLFNRNLSMVNSLSGDEVSQLCQTALTSGQSNCQGGSLPGVERYVYRGTVVLPELCSDWVFGYRLGGSGTRSETITNLLNADFYKIYVEARVNNLDFTCNSSPQFASVPVAYFCTQTNTFAQAMSEADGDSIVYSLVEPLDNIATPVPHAFGTTAINPIYDNSGFVADTHTGSIVFGSNTVQRAVVAMLVSEYRGGQLVGSVRRDMQWVILDCVNTLPEIYLPDGASFEVCADNVLTFEVGAIVNNGGGGNNTAFFTNIDEFLGATWTVSSNANDTTTATFVWQPDEAQAGNYVFTIVASDESCPIPAYMPLSIPIRVTGSPDAGSDIFYCDTANPLTATVQGGSSFEWQPLTGVTFLTNNGAQIAIDPTAIGIDGTYFTVTNNCGLSDTLHVETGAGFLLDIPEQVNICRGDSLNLTANVSPAGNYGYAWSPAAGLSATDMAGVTMLPAETTVYTLIVTDNVTGCQVTRSVLAAVTDNISATLTASADTVCAGQGVQLNAEAELMLTLSCGLTADVGACTGMLADTLQVGTGLAETTDVTPYNAFWENSHLQMLYRAEELSASGLGAATILGIGFQITDKYSSIPFETFNIKMGCSHVNTLTTFAPGTVEVLSAADVNTNTGWNWHVFDTPYTWDGLSNLLVELCQHVDNANVFDKVTYTATTFNSVCKAFTSSGSNGCTLSNQSVSSLRPDIRFIVCRPELPEPTLQWFPTEGLDNPNSHTPIATPTQTTTYTAQFSYNGCVREQSHTVVVPSPFEAEVVRQVIACSGDSLRVQLGFSAALPDGASVQWSPIVGLNSADIAAPVATLLPAAAIDDSMIYTATVVLPDLCHTVFSDSIALAWSPPMVAVWPESVSIVAGETVDLTASGSFDTVSWSPAAGLSAADTLAVTASPASTTIYTATVSYLGSEGCTASASTTITVVPLPVEEPCWVIPSAFSPNGDGMNDVFRPVVRFDGETVVTLLEVYNRYGQKIYAYSITTSGGVGTADIGWDGTYKGNDVDMGAYLCVAKLLCDGEEVLYKGRVDLVR